MSNSKSMATMNSDEGGRAKNDDQNAADWAATFTCLTSLQKTGLVISVIATKVAAGMEVRRLKVIRVVSSTTTSSLPISSAFILIPHPLQSLDWALSPDTEWKAHASSMQE
ncbi:hypothetical protein CK203_013248 [Vitis vinifera]|uniref:Uncharacterized protein n=1 Tax=Vitis vinifera TaxID=29760 RepID=A0A438JQD6_VITVI|nr:hypothetical protein CK203_013248 [Vitis vinifera]